MRRNLDSTEQLKEKNQSANIFSKKRKKLKIHLNQCIIKFKECKKLMTGLWFRVNVFHLIKRKNKISTQIFFDLFAFKAQ